MALLIIPVAPGLPAQRFTTTLDGRRWRFRLKWLQRVERWHLSIAYDDGTMLISGKALALGADLLRSVRTYADAPQGMLTVVPPGDAQPVEPTLYGLGRDPLLVYVEP
jgi:hypothetical protein